MSEKSSKISIKHWSEADRPREKLLQKGHAALSDSELLAILIGSGSAEESAVSLSQKILVSANHDLNALGKKPGSYFMRFKGIGQAKAVTIVAALELARRRTAVVEQHKLKITSSAAVFELMQPILADLPHEEFWVLYLNHANTVILKYQLSKGGITGTVVDIRLVLRKAIENGATGLILTHNHPSGTLQPSTADRNLTSKLVRAASNLDIRVLDHVIVTEKAYFSFADENLL